MIMTSLRKWMRMYNYAIALYVVWFIMFAKLYSSISLPNVLSLLYQNPQLLIWDCMMICCLFIRSWRSDYTHQVEGGKKNIEFRSIGRHKVHSLLFYFYLHLSEFALFSPAYCLYDSVCRCSHLSSPNGDCLPLY